MEMRQLKYFVAVAEELHFGRAAMRINISQPPLSLQIRNLEEELGLTLFKRTSRSVELTDAGKIFLCEVRGILEKVECAAKSARDTARGYAGRITVGFINPAMDSFLPASIHDFQRRNPGIRLMLRELSTNEQLDCLYSKRIQVGFVRIYKHRIKEFSSEIVWREPYVLAMQEHHRLAKKKKPIALRELNGEQMIMYPRSMQPSLYD